MMIEIKNEDKEKNQIQSKRGRKRNFIILLQEVEDQDKVEE